MLGKDQKFAAYGRENKFCTVNCTCCLHAKLSKYGLFISKGWHFSKSCWAMGCLCWRDYQHSGVHFFTFCVLRKRRIGKDKKGVQHVFSAKVQTTISKAKTNVKATDTITPNEQKLIDYYRKHNPDNAQVSKVRTLLLKYKGNIAKVSEYDGSVVFYCQVVALPNTWRCSEQYRVNAGCEWNASCASVYCTTDAKSLAHTHINRLRRSILVDVSYSEQQIWCVAGFGPSAREDQPTETWYMHAWKRLNKNEHFCTSMEHMLKYVQL